MLQRVAVLLLLLHCGQYQLAIALQLLQGVLQRVAVLIRRCDAA